MPKDIFALVHADLDARNEKGMREYGKTLTAFDGRNTAQDAYEELLDKVMYERKRMVEQEAALVALDRIAELAFDMRRTDREQFYADLGIIEQALGRVK